MECISNLCNLSVNSSNKIICNNQTTTLTSSKIFFRGENNVLVLEDGVHLRDSVISFNGNGAVCYLSSNRFDYYIDAVICNFCCIYIGENCYFNWRKRASLTASEYQNIIIGRDGLFSFDIHLLTADLHPIYDCDTGRRINQSKSVFIGDHVWLGQSTLILKGSRIGSGSIIGGGSVLTGKTVPSNTSFAGNPAKILRTGVFFSAECVNNWSLEKHLEAETSPSKQWVFEPVIDEYIDFSYIDKKIKAASIPQDKIRILDRYLVKNTSKNRFFIPLEK